MPGTTLCEVTMLEVIDTEELIPTNHPIRWINPLARVASLSRSDHLLPSGPEHGGGHGCLAPDGPDCRLAGSEAR
ncbi:MAG TPA: hypothetical protein VMW80_05790 [Candidatus Dormibacteraeota bacterium]|nr:hypothetical protein [Candidatus Dormibacteraeota bacterium]